jgi:amidase
MSAARPRSAADGDTRRWLGRPATELAAAVREGRVRAAELAHLHLDQLAAVEHRLGAFVAVRAEAAVADAEAVDARPDRAALPLAGVPVAVKDVVDIAGEPTRHGSEATSPELASGDHPLVTQLKDAGAVIVGKTRCPELSIWGTAEDADGIAVSPWDPTRSAGGSSGGSGAAVAAGVVPLALATDGMGSSRVPAAACGVVGFRPGEGLLPVEMAGEPHWHGLTRFGVLSTTVADTALGLGVLSGRHDHAEVAPVATRLRVGVSWRSPIAGEPVNRAWIEAALEAGRLLNAAGHHVHRADPPYTQTLVADAVSLWSQGVVRDVEVLGLDRDRLQARTRGHVALGERLVDMRPVEGLRERWRERVLPFLEEHDVLLLPGFARVQLSAARWDERPWLANMLGNTAAYPFVSAWNLADVPAVAVPMWHDRGRPLSVQVVAGPGREDLVLSVAAQLEALSPWTRHAPGWGVAS